MDAVPGECRIPIFSYRVALKDIEEKAGQIKHHIGPDKSLNAPESGIMANDEKANELNTDGEPGHRNKGIVYDLQN